MDMEWEDYKNQDKPIVHIDNRLEANHNSKSDYRKYNWVDVRDYAKKVFWNYSFEIAWAEDMCNILMFDDVVNSKNIVSSARNDYEIGDIILWLVAMYDLLFDYKVQIGLAYEFNREFYIEYTYNINSADDFLDEYLRDEIRAGVEIGISKGDIPTDYIYSDNYRVMDEYYTNIFDDIFDYEVRRRKDIVIDKIYRYFDDDYNLIMCFMQGIHWYDNYLNVNNYVENEKDKIISKYNMILDLIRYGKKVSYIDDKTKYLYEEEYEVENDMETDLMELEQYFDKFKSDKVPFNDSLIVYGWIESGMKD